MGVIGDIVDDLLTTKMDVPTEQALRKLLERFENEEVIISKY